MAELSALKALRWRRRHERTGFKLYTAAVVAARDPYLYSALGVPDTLDGRFDLIALYAFLLVHRLQSDPAPGPALAQAVFDAMFSDMDNNLREIGVSDLSVGKRVRAMWEAFHGRAKAYADSFEDPGELAAALARNVWRGEAPIGPPERLARVVRAQAAHLAGQALMAGHVSFLGAEQAAR